MTHKRDTYEEDAIETGSRPLSFALLIAFLLLPTMLLAQFFESGQDASSIKWKQINSPNFQVIFPAEFEPEANRLANTLEYIYQHVAKSLNYKPKKISVVLHSQSSNSNGFVTWAPKRMELYTTPPQDIYAHDWIGQLAIHELRHVVQIGKLNQGVTKILRILFGEQAVGGVSAFVPRWFLEGDAVAVETALTNTGRGRSAAFEMEMKALVLNRQKMFSYEKALLGSYKNYIPNHYQLGYPMVAWARQKYGPQIFDRALNFTSRNPYIPFPFPQSLKIYTKQSVKDLYKATFTHLKTGWEQQIEGIAANEATAWNHKNKKHFTSYRLPQPISDSALLVVKFGINQLKEFLVIDKNGHEKRLYIPGNFNNDKISYSLGKYVWAEEIPDIRWQNRSFYCIKIGDIATGKVRMITSQTRYFAPSLSPCGTKIAAIEVSIKNEYSLVILNSQSGQLLEKHPSPNNEFLQLPEWSSNGSSIIMTALNKKGKSIKEYNVGTNNWKELYPPSFKDISLPTYAGDYVLFSADFTGINNIYAVSRNDGSLWQVTHSKFGAFDAKIHTNGSDLFYVEYSSQGFDVVSTKFNPKSWTRVTNPVDGSPKLYETLAAQEQFNLQDSVVPTNTYPVKNYSKLAHSFNIHSWSPFYYNYDNLSLDFTAVKPGFALTSQDKLGTCIANGGYVFDNGYSYIKAKITYQALFPVFEFSTSYGGPVVVYDDSLALQKPQGTNNRFDLSGRMYTPLNFTKGAYITGLAPGIEINYRNHWFYYPGENKYSQGITTVSYSLYAYRYIKTSLRDLAPKWGATLQAKYNYSPFENEQLGSIYYVRSRIYLPGLMAHHSLQFSGGLQWNNWQRYRFTSQLALPRAITLSAKYRSYDPVPATNNLQTFTADYSFPVAYPDFALGPVFYLKRIRANLFFDGAKNQFDTYRSGKTVVTGKTETFLSTGAELTADFHLFRILFPINAGIRLTSLPKTGEYFPQLLFRIDLANY